MTPTDIWTDLNPKLVAILRGITPAETPDILRELIDAGFRAIEIPLNSPDPFDSIAAAVDAARSHCPEPCLIGAGTVLTVAEVRRIHEIGGTLVVSPNTDPEIIAATVECGMVSLPGVFTATEAFLALRSGATGLKVFPASGQGPDGIKALRAVLPPEVDVCAVGGVSDRNMAGWTAAGAAGFGLGTGLYRPGHSPAQVAEAARSAMAAARAAFGLG